MIASREFVKDLIAKVFKKKLGGVGLYLESKVTSKSCAKDAHTQITTLTLPEGVWFVKGYFLYKSAPLRCIIYVADVSISIYDPNGWVSATAADCVHVEAGKTRTVELGVWSTGKAITVENCHLKATKIANV